ncbi:hypothetical protein V5N11_003242 [Cardamine amara subsp. amara]|uniref:Uncharacterized protein n=1 Tax=Cardamine amara subsp. amara TaxID=228776 RepID=A0ABD1BTM7_CARAN
MEAFRCAVFLSPSTLLPLFSTGRRTSFKVIRCSSVSISYSSKSLKRKNYPRPKILRTLNPKPETILIGIETPENSPPSDVLSNPADDVEELQVLNSSVVSNEVNGILSKLSPKLVAKYGLYLIGIFAFQTVCAVLFFGNSTKSEKKLEISGDSGLSLSVNGERESNVVLLEDLEMNEKIAEIRMMGREARKSELKSEDYDETLNPGGGIDIEKEIEARLSNMEKRLNSQRKGLAGLRVEPLDESRNDEKSLMFEKKYKFKAEKPPMGNVNGFGGSKGNNELMSGTEKTGPNGSVSESRNGEKNPEEQQKEAGPSDSKMISGAAQESEQKRPSNEVKKSRKSGNRVGRTPNTEAGSGFGSTSLSGKPGEVRKGKPMRRAREKQSEKENKMWWLKLPYVLIILMRSNIDQDISEGYFTLRTESLEQNEGQVSYMVAFEDQSDARNFSYLLESFFEDLDDFRANIAPVSTKDLHDEVSSGSKNVIVVKKKQLTLYAGQPFEDVERALRNLIQE